MRYGNSAGHAALAPGLPARVCEVHTAVGPTVGAPVGAVRLTVGDPVVGAVGAVDGAAVGAVGAPDGGA